MIATASSRGAALVMAGAGMLLGLAEPGAAMSASRVGAVVAPAGPNQPVLLEPPAGVAVAAATHCSLPATTSLGRLYASDATQSQFARIAGGSITLGAAQRVRVQVTGCTANARYQLSFAQPILVTNGAHSVAVWPVVTAVNGTAMTPASLAGPAAGLVLTGNPELEIVFAIDPAQLPLPAGAWSGSGQATFEDR